MVKMQKLNIVHIILLISQVKLEDTERVHAEKILVRFTENPVPIYIIWLFSRLYKKFNWIDAFCVRPKQFVNFTNLKFIL